MGEIDEYFHDDLYPTSVLVQELENNDVKIRLNSIKNISTIALALGEEATRTELLPILTEVIFDEEEVLIALAEQLGELIEYVGGPEFAMCLLAPLESLAIVEDAMVRSTAIGSLRRIAAVLSANELAEHMLPLLCRLIAGNWFTARVSACCLFTSLYARVNDDMKTEMRAWFHQLCVDKLVLVRSAAATTLVELAKIVELKYLKTELLRIFVHFTEDDKDSVRFMAVNSGVVIASRLQESEISDLLITAIRLCVSDISWRVRYNIADKLLDLQLAYGMEYTHVELVPAVEYLLRDEKPKVRAHVASKVYKFCANLKPDLQVCIIKTSMLPHLRHLCNDDTVEVKSAGIAAIMNLSSLLGASETMEQVLPMLIDEFNSESLDLCTTIIPNFEVLTKVVGAEKLAEALMPFIQRFASNSKWRVRYTVIRYVPTFALNFGEELFDWHFHNLLRKWLIDRVYAIRESIGISIKDLCKLFGDKWTERSVLPILEKTLKSTYYLHRISGLHCISVLTAWCGVRLNTEHILPMVMQMTDDKVINVSYNAVKTLRNMLPYVTKEALDAKIKPILEQLCASTDVEMKSTVLAALEDLHSSKLQQSDEQKLEIPASKCTNTEAQMLDNETIKDNEKLVALNELSVFNEETQQAINCPDSTIDFSIKSEINLMSDNNDSDTKNENENENNETDIVKEMNWWRKTDEQAYKDNNNTIELICSLGNENFDKENAKNDSIVENNHTFDNEEEENESHELHMTNDEEEMTKRLKCEAEEERKNIKNLQNENPIKSAGNELLFEEAAGDQLICLDKLKVNVKINEMENLEN